MLDLKFIRENPQVVQKAAKDKGIDIDIRHVLEIDGKYKELSISVQKLREERNKFSKAQNIEEGKRVKNELEIKEHALKSVEQELNEWLLKIPNLPKADVKVGQDESENEVLRKHMLPSPFSFAPKDHLDLGEALDIIDVKRAAKVSGTRFAYLKNEGALLEFALVQLALDVLTKKDFIPIIPPVLFSRSVAIGLGYFQGKDNEEYYWVSDREFKSSNPEHHHGYYLVGTAEHTIVTMYKDEVFNENQLPRRYLGFSSAFRREAGSWGKDTRGIFRVHQFDKLEMVSFTTPFESDKEQDRLLSLAEVLMQKLEIPYQVVKMCTGDLGFPTARKYDIEAWIPSQNRYRETHSISTTTDFQARRLNIKYEARSKTISKSDGAKIEISEPVHPPTKLHVHILNGTAFAIGRTIVAIIENYQQEDGSVIVPEALRKYVGFSKITPNK